MPAKQVLNAKHLGLTKAKRRTNTIMLLHSIIPRVPSYYHRLVLASLAGLVVVIYFFVSAPLKIGYCYESKSRWTSHHHNSNTCRVTSGLKRVVITVKTGATEALDKIPTLLRTTLQCAPHVYVFSDMKQELGKRKIYDALDAISPNITNSNSDFELYRKQKELVDLSMISSILGDFKNPKLPTELAAWTLDKYKNIHIVEKAWAMKPDMDWYLHIDADSYVFVSSLAHWVRRLDPRKELFLGSLVLIGGKTFAHGGSGILLSNGATRNLAVIHNGTAARWDAKAQNHCCGDYILGRALEEYGINVTQSANTINGEEPDTIPFDENYWCQPVVTMHHVSSAQAECLADFEQRRQDPSLPVLYSEIYEGLISRRIPDLLADWDNMSEEEEVLNINSVEDCSQACVDNPDCFQTLHNGEKCFLETTHFRLGKKRKAANGKKWTSSWNKARIEAWVSAQKPCTRITFPHQ